jgi:hypothetical protein
MAKRIIVTGKLSRFDASAAWPGSALQPPCGSIVARGGKLKRRSTMFHSNTELLIDYWRARRGGRPMPRRADIDPTGFAPLAPQAFIALREPGGDITFRLAGEAILELHAAQLAGCSLLRLWRPDCRARLSMLLGAALTHAAPMAIRAEAWNEKALATELEVLFAPLAGPDGTPDRFLGLYQPLRAGWLGQLGELSILAVNGLSGAADRSRPRLAALDGRRIA